MPHRLMCYHAGVVEATARRSGHPRAAHEPLDRANPVADRPPVLRDLGRDPMGTHSGRPRIRDHEGKQKSGNARLRFYPPGECLAPVTVLCKRETRLIP